MSLQVQLNKASQNQSPRCPYWSPAIGGRRGHGTHKDWTAVTKPYHGIMMRGATILINGPSTNILRTLVLYDMGNFHYGSGQVLID